MVDSVILVARGPGREGRKGFLGCDSGSTTGLWTGALGDLQRADCPKGGGEEKKVTVVVPSRGFFRRGGGKTVLSGVDPDCSLPSLVLV